jgi:hypothetical protein
VEECETFIRGLEKIYGLFTYSYCDNHFPHIDKYITNNTHKKKGGRGGGYSHIVLDSSNKKERKKKKKKKKKGNKRGTEYMLKMPPSSYFIEACNIIRDAKARLYPEFATELTLYRHISCINARVFCIDGGVNMVIFDDTIEIVPCDFNKVHNFIDRMKWSALAHMGICHRIC